MVRLKKGWCPLGRGQREELDPMEHSLEAIINRKKISSHYIT